MRLPRLHPRRLVRHALAVAALLAQFVVAIGAPVPAARIAKPGAVPFPCQNHPCGCATSEQGWAGDCCCFTLEQKLAWAEERGIEPPQHVRATVEARRLAVQKPKKAKPACCASRSEPTCCEAKSEPAPAASEASAVRWVAGSFVQKCRGDGPAGLLKVEVTAPPAQPVDVRTELPACGHISLSDSLPLPVLASPPIPPPRVS